jgi:hypothetical protein
VQLALGIPTEGVRQDAGLKGHGVVLEGAPGAAGAGYWGVGMTKGPFCPQPMVATTRQNPMARRVGCSARGGQRLVFLHMNETIA